LVGERVNETIVFRVIPLLTTLPLIVRIPSLRPRPTVRRVEDSVFATQIETASFNIGAHRG